MIVDNIMSKSVVSVEQDDTLEVVKEIFDQTRFHHLLVVRSGKLIGVISDRDLLKSISPNIGTLAETTRDIATLNKRSHQIMTRKPVVLEPNANIYDAIDVFNKESISCIPIVNDQQRPVGMLSWRDILKALAKEEH